jgi:hypothetical protein
VPPPPPAPRGPSPARARALALARRWLPELAPLLLLVVLLSLSWPRGLPLAGLDMAPPPWWGGPRDQLLDGPDAGEWARNALLMAEGDLDALDHHRLPGWLLLLAGVMKVLPDVALAGHLSNRLLFGATALSLYAIGRLGGSRSVGLMAAGLALSAEHLAIASQRFGVDMAVAGGLSMAFALTLAATRWWGLGLLAGAAAGWATGLHYTTLPYTLPLIVLLLLRAGPGALRKAGAVALFLAGAAAVIWGMLQVYPIPQWSRFLEDIANGVNPGYRGHGSVGSVEATLDRIRAGLPPALSAAPALATSMLELPRVAALLPGWGPFAAWIGVIGVGLGLATPKRGEPPPVQAPGSATPAGGWGAVLSDMGVGVPLLLCLAPLPLLSAVDAPIRYGANLLPFVALLMARGVVGLVLLAERGLDLGLLRASGKLPLRRPLRWPVGLLSFAVAVFCVENAVNSRARVREPHRLTDDEIGTLLLSGALREAFAPGQPVACPVREAVFMAGLRYCPDRVCPVTADERAYLQCLQVLNEECKGELDIGYVATTARHFYDPNATARPQMDAWVAAQWPPVSAVGFQRFTATVHKIPRSAAPAAGSLPAWGSTVSSP